MNTTHPTTSERRIFKPAQLNALAKDLLESNFNQIWLEGEISNLARPASGHLYFTLKDERAQIRCAMFRNRALYVTTPIKDGQLVLVRARVTLYEARGDYQLAIESIDAAGHGALQLAFDRLKAQLEAEGLFSTQRKKPLPSFIKRLAILTSPNCAAIHDVLSVLSRRFLLLPIEIWPVPV
ncbi:MAG: exodeoxyribonuclease VII large subunit, partial [Arenimonas sp.]|nr:exodeoxyribonuclease VII large subunit [Arenimonas sp.]